MLSKYSASFKCAIIVSNCEIGTSTFCINILEESCSRKQITITVIQQQHDQILIKEI